MILLRITSRLFFAFLWSLACWAIWSCSTADVAGGGVDVPNTISGVLVETDGEAVTNRQVALAKLSLSLDSTEAVETIERKTNEEGEYVFGNLDTGKYVVSVPDQGDGRSGERTIVTVKAGEAAVVDTLLLKKSVVLTGTYLVPPHLTSNPLFIRVTGMDLKVRVLKEGRYIIPKAPRGDFEIAFVIADVVNTFSFNIPDNASDTIPLPPLQLSFFEKEAESINYAYIDVTEHCFQILPRSPENDRPVEYLIYDEEGRRKSIHRPKPKPGDVLTGIISIGDTEVTITSDSNTYSLPKSRLRFTPKEGQEVMLLVDGNDIIDVAPLDDRPLDHRHGPKHRRGPNPKPGADHRTRN